MLTINERFSRTKPRMEADQTGAQMNARRKRGFQRTLVVIVALAALATAIIPRLRR